jgi:carbon-monoxide dehydrogenase large subunit
MSYQRTIEPSRHRFGVGQPAPRAEDPVLIRGEGRYTDDMRLPEQCFAAFVRAEVAHGTILAVDVDAARATPGVLAVYLQSDLEAAGRRDFPCNLPLKNQDGSPMAPPPRPILARGAVRFLGECMACVVAETPEAARDGAEAVSVEIEALPAVMDAERALEAGATPIHPGGNQVLDHLVGDLAAVEAAMAKAAHVVRLRLEDNRVAVAPMETRAALAVMENGRYVLRAPSQGVMGLRASIADALGVEAAQVHVLTGHVGGSFGMKIAAFPEYVCLLHAARDLGRPVGWADDRAASFMSDLHGRAMVFDAALALDAEGNFLALKLDTVADMGAYTSHVGPMMPTMVLPRNIASIYRTPAIAIRSRCAFTNSSPVGAYRGAGRPEGNYVMERLIEEAARRMGVDPIALRRKNLVRPEELPWSTPMGTLYDDSDFEGLLDAALKSADWDGFPARRAASAAKGLLRGRGLGAYLEATAIPTNESGSLRFETDGTLTILTGTLDFGQGHLTSLAQILVDELGVPFEKVRLVQGDSDRLIAGAGTGGSKSLMASGAATLEAARIAIEKGKRAAAALFETAVADVEFADGRFVVAGTDRAIGLFDLAKRLREGPKLPDDAPETLDVDHVHKSSPCAYPNGAHVVELEIDPETGETRIDRYLMVNDFGVVVNPMIVEGQTQGGAVQGIGQALMEKVIYDEDGQLLTGSFMDYAMPRASDAPSFRFESRPIAARTNLIGAKGCGEAGCAGALSSVMNAVLDALRPYGVHEMQMPATPQKIWKAIQAAR